MTTTTDEQPGDIYAASNLLFRHRHSLPNDILRSLQSIWFCASAARFGEPYEQFWLVDDEGEYAAHDTAECEAESAIDEDVTTAGACGMTHAQHAAAWRSWKDDCDSCGYAQQDPQQCAIGHPDDGVTACGACGFDARAEATSPREAP